MGGNKSSKSRRHGQMGRLDTIIVGLGIQPIVPTCNIIPHRPDCLAMAIDKYVKWDEPGVEYGQGPEEDAVIHEIEEQM